MKKNAVSALTIIAAVLLYAACGKTDAKKIKVRFAGTEGDSTPQSKMLYEVADRLNASGYFDADVFTSGALSSDTDDLVTQALQGSSLIVPSDPARLSANQKVPDFGILMAPYVLKDYRVLDKLHDTPLYQQWEKDFEKTGLKLIANNFYNGMRHFITNKEIKTPADLQGLRIRGFSNSVGNGLAKNLGYAQTSIPATDIYTGVQSKAVDGCEIQTPTSYGYRLWEVLKYTTKTGHYMLTSSIVCGTEFFNRLPKEAQDALVETFRSVCSEYQAKVAKIEQNDLTEMQEKGMVVTEVNTAPFEAAVEPLYTELGFSAGLKDELFRQLCL